MAKLQLVFSTQRYSCVNLLKSGKVTVNLLKSSLEPAKVAYCGFPLVPDVTERYRNHFLYTLEESIKSSIIADCVDNFVIFNQISDGK